MMHDELRMRVGTLTGVALAAGFLAAVTALVWAGAADRRDDRLPGEGQVVDLEANPLPQPPPPPSSRRRPDGAEAAALVAKLRRLRNASGPIAAEIEVSLGGGRPGGGHGHQHGGGQPQRFEVVVAANDRWLVRHAADGKTASGRRGSDLWALAAWDDGHVIRPGVHGAGHPLALSDDVLRTENLLDVDDATGAVRFHVEAPDSRLAEALVTVSATHGHIERIEANLRQPGGRERVFVQKLLGFEPLAAAEARERTRPPFDLGSDRVRVLTASARETGEPK